jgi:predicted MFS family arabinose efflux permease
MSLTVGTGQLGFALGGVLAGLIYARAGFGSSTAASGAFLLVSTWIIWRFLPEPESHGPAVVQPSRPEVPPPQRP